MFNSFFLFIILLAFKHAHLISSLEVLPCIPLHLLSSWTFLAFFDKLPCPTSLNIVLYPSRWRPPLTVPRQKLLPPCHSFLAYMSSFPTKLSHKSTYPTPSSLQSRSTIPFTAILFEFLHPCILFPNTGKIPNMMISPTLACFVFFSSFLFFSTIAVVPSLSVSFVPTCTSIVPPFPLPMTFSTLSVTCSILAPGKHNTTSSPLLSLASVFRMIESPTLVLVLLLMPSITAAE